jgi:peptide/nickel transport system substrate-binding protein
LGSPQGAATIAASSFKARAKSADAKTLRFIAQADLVVLDPIWTTAYITRNHGYMVFDTLFALDSEFKPHPQMVEAYGISADKLRYTFTLRDGLKFHDGEIRSQGGVKLPLKGSRGTILRARGGSRSVANNQYDC